MSVAEGTPYADKLDLIVKNHKVKKGEKFNFIIVSKPGARLFIPPSLYDEFYDTYSKARFLETKKKPREYNFREEHDEYGPIIVDFDFKVKYMLDSEENDDDPEPLVLPTVKNTPPEGTDDVEDNARPDKYDPESPHNDIGKDIVLPSPMSDLRSATDGGDLSSSSSNKTMKGQQEQEITKIYTKDNLYDILEVYKEVLTEMYDLASFPEGAPERHVFVMEKITPDILYKDGFKVLKDGLHLQYNGIITDVSTQYYIRYEVLRRLFPVAPDGYKNLSALKGSTFESLRLIEPPDTILDTNVINPKFGWMLFGSKKQYHAGYILTDVYDIITLETIDWKKYYGGLRALPKLLSIKNRTKCTLLLPTVRESINLFEAGGGNPLLTKKKRTQVLNDINEKEEAMKALVPIKDTRDDISRALPDIPSMRRILFALSQKRADNYSEWISVGWCLHNISNGSPLFLDLWKEFSQRSPKYKDDENNPHSCDAIWGRAKDEGYTIRSLYYWLKCDAPEVFQDVISKQVTYLILQHNGEWKTHDITEIAKHIYKDEFVCADVKHNVWYHFKNHKWNELNDGSEILRLMSTDFAKYFINASRELQEIILKVQMQVATLSESPISPEEEAKQNKKYSAAKSKSACITTLCENLRDITFMGKLLKHFAIGFEDAKFMQKIDTNYHLLCMTNGVYDLDASVFRDGLPGDYISYCTGQTYDPELLKSPHLKEIQDFFEKIQPNPNMRHYLLRVLASCLYGNFGNEKINMWFGKGRNGKSKIIALMEYVMGDYACKIPPQVLTQKRPLSNQASPEIARARGKRFASTQEPDTGDALNVGVLKELTGGDKLISRMLFNNPIEFRPQYHLFYMVNIFPEIRALDDGTWERILVLYYPSKFTQFPKKPNEFLIDTTISKKVYTWAPTFLMYLIDYFNKEVKGKSLKVPDEVLSLTMEYRQHSDIYYQFIKENLIATSSEKDTISLSQLFTYFKSWYMESYPNSHSCSDKNELNEYFRRNFENNVYDTAKYTLIGYRLQLKG